MGARFVLDRIMAVIRTLNAVLENSAVTTYAGLAQSAQTIWKVDAAPNAMVIAPSMMSAFLETFAM